MFSQGSYLKVWEVKKVEAKYVDAQCTTSRKKDDGTYETDFSGFVRFCGKAFDDVKGANKGDSFKIVRCGVTQTYNKEKKQNFTNFVVFEVENGNSGQAKPTQTTTKNPSEFVNLPDALDEELPFN